MFKNFKFKPLLIGFFVVIIAVSFVFLKIKERYQARDFIDTNEKQQEVVNHQGETKYSSQVKKFANLQEFRDFIKKNTESDAMLFGGDDLVMGLKNQALVSPSASPEMVGVVSDEVRGLGDALDFSTTNIQVQGVDEADIVKTDGDYIYYASGQNLYIINSYPAEEAKIVSKIEFKSFLTDIYAQGDSLVVFGYDYPVHVQPLHQSRMFIPTSPSVFLQVYDISDRSRPEKKQDIEIDGSYLNSRLIGNYLYFFVNNYDYNDLPRIAYQGNVLDFDCQPGLKCAPSEIYYVDDFYSGRGDLTSAITLNIADFDSEPKNYFYLLPAGQNMYVSQGNIYLTYTKYLNEYEIETEALVEIIYPRLTLADQGLIDDINVVSDNILSPSEKRAKIRRILDLYLSVLSFPERDAFSEKLKNKISEKYPNILDEMEKTVIHKIAAFNGSLEAIFKAEIPGSILNQFSMDEHDGFFRIATTRNQTWSRFTEESIESYNNLYILDSNLDVAGEIKGLATGERIYSVRFVGDRAYIVTFKQVDPLFSIDLKDPFNPKVLGELKIPGFSNYLHPYSNKILIGFGKDVEDSGDGVVEGGIKLSLFDVSAEEPVEIDSYIIGDAGSGSIALYDHRAFLFSRDKNILAVPAVLRDKTGDGYWGKVSFNGLLVFNIIDNQFVLQGQIKHSPSTSFDDYYSDSVKRGLFIEDNLYSLSDRMLKINSLDDLSDVLSIELE